ncbi:hypothetical protein ACWEKM_36920 [Streptomyces sp. NPDC004752]
MPLKIRGVQPVESPTVDLDEYVPLTAQWPAYSRLRQAPISITLDVGASLVEIKTDQDSGEVVEVILVDLVRPEEKVLPLPVPTTVDSGVPVLSYDESAQDPSAGGVQLYTDGLCLRFGPESVARGVGDSTAVFGFSDQGNLAEFVLRLSPPDITRLRACLASG